MMTRAIDKEMDGMCDLSKGVREEGHAEGLKQGLEKGRIEMAVENVRSLMKELNKTLNEAMQILKIDESIRPEVKKAINAKTNLTVK